MSRSRALFFSLIPSLSRRKKLQRKSPSSQFNEDLVYQIKVKTFQTSRSLFGISITSNEYSNFILISSFERPKHRRRKTKPTSFLTRRNSRILIFQIYFSDHLFSFNENMRRYSNQIRLLIFFLSFFLLRFT